MPPIKHSILLVVVFDFVFLLMQTRFDASSMRSKTSFIFDLYTFWCKHFVPVIVVVVVIAAAFADPLAIYSLISFSRFFICFHFIFISCFWPVFDSLFPARRNDDTIDDL